MDYKRKLFLCRSYYHLMIAVSKSFTDPENSLICCVKEEFDEQEIDKIIINCEAFGLEIVTISQKEKTYELDFKYHDTLFLFHWAVHKNPERSFFNEFEKKNVILIEDGATHHEVFRSQKYTKTRIIKNIINFITTGNLYVENSKRIKEILVTFPDKYPINIQKKMKKLSLHISNEDEIDMYMKIFNVAYSVDIDPTRKRAIVFTQPLSEDGFVSEGIKKEMYFDIFKDLFHDGYEIYLKQHPREISNYEDEISNFNIINLPQNFPGELINFMGFQIDKAISICSGVVYNITANERIQLNENFFVENKKKR